MLENAENKVRKNSNCSHAHCLQRVKTRITPWTGGQHRSEGQNTTEPGKISWFSSGIQLSQTKIKPNSNSIHPITFLFCSLALLQGSTGSCLYWMRSGNKQRQLLPSDSHIGAPPTEHNACFWTMIENQHGENI